MPKPLRRLKPLTPKRIKKNLGKLVDRLDSRRRARAPSLELEQATLTDVPTTVRPLPSPLSPSSAQEMEREYAQFRADLDRLDFTPLPILATANRGALSAWGESRREQASRSDAAVEAAAAAAAADPNLASLERVALAAKQTKEGLAATIAAALSTTTAATEAAAESFVLEFDTGVLMIEREHEAEVEELRGWCAVCTFSMRALRRNHAVCGLVFGPNDGARSRKTSALSIALVLLCTLGIASLLAGLSSAPHAVVRECRRDWVPLVNNATAMPSPSHTATGGLEKLVLHPGAQCTRFAMEHECDGCVASEWMCRSPADASSACAAQRCYRFVAHCFFADRGGGAGDVRALGGIATFALADNMGTLAVRTLATAATAAPLKLLARLVFRIAPSCAAREDFLFWFDPLRFYARWVVATVLLLAVSMFGVGVYIVGVVEDTSANGFLETINVLRDTSLAVCQGQIISVPFVLLKYWVWERRCGRRNDALRIALEKKRTDALRRAEKRAGGSRCGQGCRCCRRGGATRAAAEDNSFITDQAPRII